MEFLRDGGSSLTFGEFLKKVSEKKAIKSVLRPESFADFFVDFAAALAGGANVVLADADMTSAELSRFGLKEFSGEQRVEIPQIKSFGELVLLARNSKSKISLFTSGSEGRPKMAAHTVGSLSRFAKVSERHAGDVWAFAYSPSHIAGVQIFLQAFFNSNKIVNVFGKPAAETLEALALGGVNRISATPTFYRLIPAGSIFDGVKSAGVGGEKCGADLLERLRRIFPNAKIRNVYASTEFASLLSSEGDAFEIPESLRGLVKIENGEVLVSISFVGEGDLPAERVEGGFYKTGDFVEFLDGSKTKFRFAGRASSFVNVGGYKANLEEVEEALRSICGVRDAVCYARKNSLLGNVVCAKISAEKGAELSEAEIRRSLSKRLQNFKIPRKFEFVEKLESTKTGKAKRL